MHATARKEATCTREIKSVRGIPGMSRLPAQASNSWCILLCFQAKDRFAPFFWIWSRRGGGARVDWCASGGRHICRMQWRVSFTPLGRHGFDSGSFRSLACTQTCQFHDKSAGTPQYLVFPFLLTVESGGLSQKSSPLTQRAGSSGPGPAAAAG